MLTITVPTHRRRVWKREVSRAHGRAQGRRSLPRALDLRAWEERCEPTHETVAQNVLRELTWHCERRGVAPLSSSYVRTRMLCAWLVSALLNVETQIALDAYLRHRTLRGATGLSRAELIRLVRRESTSS